MSRSTPTPTPAPIVDEHDIGLYRRVYDLENAKARNSGVDEVEAFVINRLITSHEALRASLGERDATIAALRKELDEAKKWVVHNHGPDEGLGVECPEYRINGRLVGHCLIIGPSAEAVRVRADARRLSSEAIDVAYRMQDEHPQTSAIIARLANIIEVLLDDFAGASR